MAKTDDFKLFAKKHPELLKYVKEKKNTWQDFYEIYDIYGEDETKWGDYLDTKEETKKTEIPDLTKIVKNIDMDNIQKHINTAQKALGLIEELTVSKASGIKSAIKGPLKARPLNKFFED